METENQHPNRVIRVAMKKSTLVACTDEQQRIKMRRIDRSFEEVKDGLTFEQMSMIVLEYEKEQNIHKNKYFDVVCSIVNSNSEIMGLREEAAVAEHERSVLRVDLEKTKERVNVLESLCRSMLLKADASERRHHNQEKTIKKLVERENDNEKHMRDLEGHVIRLENKLKHLEQV